MSDDRPFARRKRKGPPIVGLDRSSATPVLGVPPPLSPAAEAEREQWRRQVLRLYDQMAQIRLRIIIWGPADSTSPGGKLRLSVYEWLAAANHVPEFPEATCAPNGTGLYVQELLQASTADLVIAIACSPGAITEAVDASVRPAIAGKLLVLLDEEHRAGFMFKKLIENQATGAYRVIQYAGVSTTACEVLKSSVIARAERVREKKYLKDQGLEHDGSRS